MADVPVETFYVSDLDGTLLAPDGELSAASRAALKEMLADGLAFSVASARSVESMRPKLVGLGLSLPVIELNGAFVSDLETGRHEVVNAIDACVVQDIFALLSRSDRAPVVSTFDGKEDCLYYTEATNLGESFYVSDRLQNRDRRLRQISDLARALQEQVVCLTVIAEAGPLADLEMAIRDAYGDHVEIHLFENQYSPGWFWLTVHDRRATKDQGIRLLADAYGLARHELVVFGDHINDIRMFQAAARAVAVANAHPDVKRHATHLIGANHEDSVVDFIRRDSSRCAWAPATRLGT